MQTLRSGSAWPADSSFLGGSSLPFGRPKRCKNLRSGTAGTLFVSWRFKPAVLQPSRVHKLRSSTAQPAHYSFLGGEKTPAAAQPAHSSFLGASSLPCGSFPRCTRSAAAQPGRQTLLFLGVQACHLAGLKGAKTSAAAQPAHSSFLGASSLPFGSLQGCTSSAAARHSRHTLLFLGVQACRLAGLKGAKTSAAAQPAHSSFLGASSLPFGSFPRCTRSAAAQHGRQALLFLRVQACRLAGLKGAKASAAAQPAHSSFLGASSLPFGSFPRCTRSGLKGAKTSAAQPAHSSFLGPTPTAAERAKRSNSQPVPPPRKGGVGGTRALAHSIKQDKTRYKTR